MANNKSNKNNNSGNTTSKRGRKNHKYNGAKNNNRNRNYDETATTKESYDYRKPDAFKSNDVSWYNKDAIMFSDATRVPFNKISGVPYQNSLTLNDGNMGVYAQSTITPAGIMRIVYTPGIGVSTNYASAPNRAFQAMWSAIYSKTTGAMQFPQYALGLTVTAIMSIAQNIAYLKRAIETSNLYSAKNRNYPMALLKAQGITPSSVIGKQDECRTALNSLIRDFNSLKIPAYIDVFKRHYTLAKNVYADQDSVTAQLYVFVPSLYYAYSDLGQYDATTKEWDGKAALIPYPFDPATTETGVDFGDIIRIIQFQIESVRSSSDFHNISGAVMRAFPDEAMMSIDACGMDDTLLPVVDDIIPYQIHNSEAVGLPMREAYEHPMLPAEQYLVPTNYRYKDHVITGDPVTNVIKYEPTVPWLPFNDEESKPESYTTGKHVLNTFNNSITPDEIMEYTRLMGVWYSVFKVHEMRAVSIGTEYINTYYVWYPGKVDANTPSVYDEDIEMSMLEIPSLMILTNRDGLAMTASLMERIQALSKFHRAPRVHMVIYNGSSAKYLGYCGDVNLWTNVTADALQGLHDCALLSIFSTKVPIKV